MSVSSRVGTAVAAGYVLGRFKKLRLAVLVGSALANKNIRDAGVGLLTEGTRRVAATPEAKTIATEQGSRLLEAGRSAALAAATSRMNRLSDKLQERTVALTGEVPTREDLDKLADESDDEADDEADDRSVDEGQEYDDEADVDEDYDDEDYEDEDEADEDEADEDYEDEEDEGAEEEPDEQHQRRSPRRRRTAAPAGRS